MPTIPGDPKVITSIRAKISYGRVLLPVFAVLIVAAAACGSSGPDLPGLGDEVTLAVGGSIEVDTGDGRALIQFISLEADSRCRQGVQCIAAGEATIILGLTLEDGARRAFPVTIPPGGGLRSEVVGFALTITALLPDPPLENMSESLYRAVLNLTRP